MKPALPANEHINDHHAFPTDHGVLARTYSQLAKSGVWANSAKSGVQVNSVDKLKQSLKSGAASTSKHRPHGSPTGTPHLPISKKLVQPVLAGTLDHSTLLLSVPG